MKKNKFFAGVIVLLFVLSFSVSQVLLAQVSEVCECPIGTVSQRCAHKSTPNSMGAIVWNCNCETMGPQNVTQWSTCPRPAFPWE